VSHAPFDMAINTISNSKITLWHPSSNRSVASIIAWIVMKCIVLTIHSCRLQCSMHISRVYNTENIVVIFILTVVCMH